MPRRLGLGDEPLGPELLLWALSLAGLVTNSMSAGLAAGPSAAAAMDAVLGLHGPCCCCHGHLGGLMPDRRAELHRHLPGLTQFAGGQHLLVQPERHAEVPFGTRVGRRPLVADHLLPLDHHPLLRRQEHQTRQPAAGKRSSADCSRASGPRTPGRSLGVDDVADTSKLVTSRSEPIEELGPEPPGPAEPVSRFVNTRM